MKVSLVGCARRRANSFLWGQVSPNCVIRSVLVVVFTPLFVERCTVCRRAGSTGGVPHLSRSVSKARSQISQCNLFKTNEEDQIKDINVNKDLLPYSLCT